MSRISENEGAIVRGDSVLEFKRCDIVAQVTGIGFVVRAGTNNFTERVTPAEGSVSAEQDGMTASFRTRFLAASLRFSTMARSQSAEVVCEIANASSGPIHLVRQEIELDVTVRFGETFEPARTGWFRNGWQSWSFAGAVRGDNPDIPTPRIGFIYDIKEDPEVPRRKARFVSDMVTAVKLGDNAIVAGAYRQRFFQQAEVEPKQDRFILRLSIDLDMEPLAPGARLEAGGWQFEGERRSTVIIKRWGERTGQRNPRTKRIVGWCSWYDRQRRITGRYIAKNVARIKSDDRLAPLQVVLIDDGYEDRVGDWLAPSRRYGEALSKSASGIAEAGLVPGIWVAPFIAQAGSTLLKKHPEWFQTRKGKKRRIGWNPHWKAAFYAIDPRNEEFLHWLGRLFATLRGYGFRVFKLDYLFPAAYRTDRAHNSAGRYLAFRNALSVIRDAVGEESVLMGCGCPLAPARGLIDAMRVSTDVAYSWEGAALIAAMTGDRELMGIRPAVRNTMARATFAKSFWLVDPDCVLLRKRRGTATRNELEVQAILAALNRDVFLIGDDLTRWKEEDIERFSMLAGLGGGDFLPLDSADMLEPVWAVAGDQSSTYLAAFNLGEYAEMRSLPLPLLVDRFKRGTVRSVTSHESAFEEDRISVSKVERHSCAVVQTDETATPDEGGAAGWLDSPEETDE